MRRWLEVSLEVPPAARDAIDAIGAWLVTRGAPGIIEEDLGESVRLRAHFEEGQAARAIADEGRAFLVEIDSLFPGTAAGRVAVAIVDEEDWAEGWKQGFPPLEVGRRLRVRTPWTAPDPHRVEVEILPAMAFGTGRHGSTLGCLLAIDELFDRSGGPSTVLDVGTGSAILAIAAAKLGAESVVAVDVDPVAIEGAAENLARNGVERRVRLVTGSIEDVKGRFELIVANLFAGLLRESVALFAARAAPRARLVVAGLLDADRGSVAEAAGAAGWELEAERSLEGWTTLVLRKR